jgi:hypothetical protein
MKTLIIPYKDKKREEQRLQALGERRTYQAEKEKRKVQKQKKWELKQQEKKRKLQEFMATNEERDDDDNDEIMKESRLLKKLRKGKITEEEFEKQTGDRKFEKLLTGEDASIEEDDDMNVESDHSNEVVEEDSVMDDVSEGEHEQVIEGGAVYDQEDFEMIDPLDDKEVEDPLSDDRSMRKKKQKRPKKSHVKIPLDSRR